MVYIMTDEERQRKSITFRIDELTIDILNKLARLENQSRNRFLEDLLLKLGKENKVVDDDVEPLGETRGKKWKHLN